METISAAPDKQQWTLADFLSSYRFWALFVAASLVTLAEQGANTVFPVVLTGINGSSENIAIFFLGTAPGWIVGAFLAFIVASRRGLPALLAPLGIAILAALVPLALPGLWDEPVFLFLFGLSIGALRGVFALAIAIFLFGGRSTRIDFGSALTLMSVTIILGFAAPFLWAVFYRAADDINGLILAFVALMIIAAAMLVLARKVEFDDQPRQRHRPLPVRRRSPVAVALILAAPTLLAIALVLGAEWLQHIEIRSETGYVLNIVFALASIGLAIFAFLYLAWWAYHIHGELAGAEQSQRLLTPWAGLLVAVLVPLGLPVLLMTLADLVNDRAKARGEAPLASIAWIGIWSFVFAPVAIALIQDAANRSYDLAEPAA